MNTKDSNLTIQGKITECSVDRCNKIYSWRIKLIPRPTNRHIKYHISFHYAKTENNRMLL